MGMKGERVEGQPEDAMGKENGTFRISNIIVQIMVENERET